MAQFPTSVKSFSALANGNTIQATDVSDARDEITAIEDGYLNGTARLNSSGSTVASLSVTGGSTLAGALQVTGASTFTGALTLNGGIASTVSFASSVTFSGSVTVVGALSATQQSVPTVKVTQSANQNTVSGGIPNWQGLSWDTDVFNVAGMHSTSANSSRLTFSASSGIYEVTAQVEFAQNATGNRYARIYVNDSSGAGGVAYPSISGDPTSVNVTALVRAASTTDYVTVQVMQTSGSTLSVTNSTAFGSWFSARKVSAQ